MADISNQVRVIQEEAPGESVRDAIIQLIKIIHNVGGNVFELNGHPFSDFISYNEAMDWYEVLCNRLQYTDKPTNDPTDGKKLLSSGAIYDAIQCITDVLEDLNHYEIPMENLPDNLVALESAKAAIWSAIRTQSGNRVSNTKKFDFWDYARIIREELTVGTAVSRGSTTLSTNGHHEPEPPDNPTDPISAWNEVKVDVPFKTTTASSRGYDDFSATGEYIGYTKVTVNVSSSSAGSGRTTGRGSSTIDENGIADLIEINDAHVDITAESEGVSGWRTVKVRVTDLEINPDATYKVKFFDDDEVTQIGEEVSVKYGENCDASKIPDVPDRGNEHFVGWDPAPNKIMKDTDCFAVYSSAPISETEISDPWDQIIANRGMPYGYNQYKTLALQNGWGNVRMQKVWSGEDSSTTTWVAMDSLANTVLYEGYSQWGNYGGADNIGRCGWSYSNLRTWLNSEFYMDILPSSIRDAIIPVQKYTFEYDTNIATKYMTVVKDLVWIPSLTEILGQDTIAMKQQIAELQYAHINVASDGRWGTRVGNYRDYDRYALSELRGIHYNHTYPDSEIVVTTAPYPQNWTRQGTDKSKLIKYKCGNLSSPVDWYTRTATGMGLGYNSNWYGVFNAGFRTNGDYHDGLYGGAYSSNAEVIIGFCL